MDWYPLTFEPIFAERVWGGRRLAELFRKPLPPESPIGESWEISDRPEAVSRITNGPLAGKDLRWLMEQHSAELMGKASDRKGRFPLLVKILDAQSTLSLQVHPPPSVAEQLGGEPKTEMWYIAEAQPGAELYVGLKKGVTRERFEEMLRDGRVADCFHQIPVQAGDVMFLPSGRVHAIGAGIVIFEIQQSSDTTYRVFDWNRVGLDGKPRALHIEESLASIDFSDFEPSLIQSSFEEQGERRVKPLVQDPLFSVELEELDANGVRDLKGERPVVLAVIQGDLKVAAGPEETTLTPGDFCLVPAACEGVQLSATKPTQHLQAVPS